MGLLNMLLILLIISSFLYLLFCLNPREGTFLFKIKDFFMNKLFNYLLCFGNKILGKRFENFIKWFINYIFFENNPIIQIFYYCIIIFGDLLFYYYIIQNIQFFNIFELGIEIILFISGLNFYYLCCNTNPGYLTKKNFEKYKKKYQKDYNSVLYEKGNICKSCEIEKPPMTKHCNICKKCIIKHDHHCIWIKGCVGETNYKWFISFIGSHSLFCGFKTYMLSKIIYKIVLKDNLFKTQYKNLETGEIFEATYFMVFKYLFGKYNYLIFLIILTITMSVALFFFLLYHFYLIKLNNSTSENIKRNSYHDYFKNEIIKIADEILELEKEKEVNKKLIENKKKELKDCEINYNIITEQRENLGFIYNLKEIFQR